MKLFKSYFLVFCLLASVVSATGQRAVAPSFKLDYEKFTLPNGLDVIFHIDRSDPVVAVNLTAHVGSAREKAGRTGFAHLFEHLLFLDSENLEKGGLDRLSTRIGGSGANGSTTRDRTNYLQTVPKDALEKMIWAEAEKLGWFINTVTEEVVATEKQVVKNEKRQGVDNSPYGHTSYVIDKAACPSDHPYNWQVIGSLDDLEAATLADVKEFYRKWYVPNNVTLVIAGDFDPAQAKRWVEKYFGEIKRGPDVEPLKKEPCTITSNIKLYHEDNFARLPELTYAWATVERYHPDSYALGILANYLTRGKKAPFYKVIVEDKKLAPNVSMFNSSQELAGRTQLSVRAFVDKDLDEVAASIADAFAKFEKEGISESDLSRIKAGQETSFYNGLSSVLGKSNQLAEGNIYASDPAIVEKDIARVAAVTPADVKRVYNTYIKGKNFISTSFVPKGKVQLALEGSKKADVVEEKIVAGAGDAPANMGKREFERTPSSFDRTVEPPYGTSPEVKIPAVWDAKLANGLRVYGIENDEVPLVQFEIAIDGGQRLESLDKAGVANLMARMMTQGTAKRTPEELEEAIQQLGASINVSAGSEQITVSINTLARNYDATLALVEEILLEPRWDAKEFDLVKQSTISSIRQLEANPNAIAEIEFDRLIYGKNDIRSVSTLGTLESVRTITLDDLKAFYHRSVSPSVGRMHIVGSLGKNKIVSSLKRLESRWKAKRVDIPKLPAAAAPTKSTVYFYDVPEAKQSVIAFGYPGLAATDKDFYPATVMNYILGGGGFASRLTLQLREAKGYTYGIRSGFSGSTDPGTFTISSSIRTNVTLEAAQLIKDIAEEYGSTYTSQDLETTKSAMVKSQARAFETAGSKLNMLDNISRYGWKPNYIKEREQIIKGMTVEEVRRLAGKYLDPKRMIYLVVGDAKTQLPRLKELGFGDPVVISK
jgi:zinc protease